MKLNKWALALLAGFVAVAIFAFWQTHRTDSILPTKNTQPVVLAGNTPASLKQAEFIRHSDPAKPITVAVGLQLHNEPQLETLLAAQADPNSPEFRKYLTPDEFANRFGPTQQEYDLVSAYLKSKGLKVAGTYPNRLIVVAEGSLAQMESAFGVTINEYRYMGGVQISNDADPSVPGYLQGVVQSVSGLNTFAEFRSKYRRDSSFQHMPHSSAPSGFTPRDIATAYNYPNANNTAAGDKYSGAGRTVAIATAYSYSQADVNAYWRQFGITRTGKVTNIPIAGTTNQLEGETTLDLQQVGGQAPGADILMYLGHDPKFTTFAMIFNQIVVDNKADVVSVSWGLCERDTGPSQMKTENDIFKQGAAQGMAVFASSGDDGAYDCRPDPNEKDPAKKKPILSVDYPSSDPNVVAVGGTMLILNMDQSRALESAWVSGGGGISSVYARPAWQSGPGLPAGDKRVTADVSLVSDPMTGYAMYFEGDWGQSGGTSFAAPAWAGLWALMDEAVGGRLGHPLPILYAIGRSADYSKVFYDVTSGSNGDGRGPGYSSGTAWDYPTGWGTPNGGELAQWLKTCCTK